MVAILFTWYFQSLGISLGVLPTALLAIPFAVVLAPRFFPGPLGRWRRHPKVDASSRIRRLRRAWPPCQSPKVLRSIRLRQLP
jgi:hypothetical protein